MACSAGGGGLEGLASAQEKDVPKANESIKSLFKCKECRKTYKQRTSLNNHMKKVHIQNGTAMSSEISKDPCLKKTQENPQPRLISPRIDMSRR